MLVTRVWPQPRELPGWKAHLERWQWSVSFRFQILVDLLRGQSIVLWSHPEVIRSNQFPKQNHQSLGSTWAPNDAFAAGCEKLLITQPGRYHIVLNLGKPRLAHAQVVTLPQMRLDLKQCHL